MRSLESALGVIGNATSGTRGHILYWLARNGEMCVGEITEAVGVAQTQVSSCLATMKLGGLVEGRKEGKRVYYSLTPTGKVVGKLVEAVMLQDFRDAQEFVVRSVTETS